MADERRARLRAIPTTNRLEVRCQLLVIAGQPATCAPEGEPQFNASHTVRTRQDTCDIVSVNEPYSTTSAERLRSITVYIGSTRHDGTFRHGCLPGKKTFPEVPIQSCGE